MTAPTPVSSFTDIMISRLSTAPTNPTTTPPPPVRVALPQGQVWTYDQFSDPAQSGFGGVPMMYAPPLLDPAALRVSRTMQYVDPYAAVGVSLGTSTEAPASDEPYTGYR
jgi:hypothetical protein